MSVFRTSLLGIPHFIRSSSQCCPYRQSIVVHVISGRWLLRRRGRVAMLEIRNLPGGALFGRRSAMRARFQQHLRRSTSRRRRRSAPLTDASFTSLHKASVTRRRNATHRNSAGTLPALAETYNTVLIACRKLLRYRFFATFLSDGKRLLCGALRYGIFR